jgi:putative transposase
LLAIGQELDHDVADVIGIVTPKTYARWVMELREGRRPKRVGRSRIPRNMREIVIRLAKDNCNWGYRRIVGELRKLRLWLGQSSVRQILKEEGLTPSFSRRGRADETVWQKFIRLRLDTLVTCDISTKAVITRANIWLADYSAFIRIGRRKVFLSPPTFHPRGQGGISSFASSSSC